MHRTWRLWSLRLTPDLFFWPKENRELRGGGSTWYETARVNVLSRCLLWVQGGGGHTILSVTMLILEYSGLAVALFPPQRLVETSWSAGCSLV